MALHLDETQLAGTGHAALDVVAELLELAVSWLETETAFNLRNNIADAGSADP